MAEAIPTNQDLFMCAVCLDVLKDPVTLNCGHNYCVDCIKRCWNLEDEKGVYSCPQCRQTFSPRPVLNKNNVLAELVEQLRKTRIQAVPAHCYAVPGELECDVCTGRKLKAVKSCLDCLLSYCESHFKAHNDLHPGRQHKVIEATGQLQERICTQHEKPLEIFCRTDQSCICFLCMVDEHKGHDTISASAGRKEKQTDLEETQRTFQQMIQVREKDLQQLRKAVTTLKNSAQSAVENSERMFAEMIRSIERRCSEVTKLIRAQEKAEVSRAEGLLKQLEQEIAELKRREAELEQLSHTEDHIHFLKTFQSATVSSKPEDTPSIHVSERLSFEAVMKSVSTLKEQLEDICKQEVIKISASGFIGGEMAEAIPTNQDLFMCPVCLDVLKDPVTLHCGHNYCMDCIKGCWNLEDEKGVYSCPQCRQTFSPRPVLNKNNVLAELVEQLRKTRIQAVPAHAYAVPGELGCDVCIGRKLKAVKSCLDCLLSYCETHFKAHNDLNPGRQHKVIDATGQLQERICTQHEKPLEIFCRTDQSCICFLCMVGEHKGHDTISASAGRKEKQTDLEETQRTFQQMIQVRKKDLQQLRKAVTTLKNSAQSAVENSERMFAEMIRSIERRCSEVTELIRAQEKAEVSRAEGLLKQLEQEIAELKRRDAELEQLSHTEDHINFLKSATVSSKPEDTPSIHVSERLSFEAVMKSVSTLKEQLEDICKQEDTKISASGLTEVQVLFTEPTTREEFLKYSCNFTLDPDTAQTNLYLSEGNRRVDRRPEVQPYPHHPDRFQNWCQVLCREGLSGRCYWEVEWRGEGVYIAVSYKSISRKGSGNNVVFGGNNQSWMLDTFNSSFKHNNTNTKLPLVASSRIGVYVNHSAGILAFYSISDTMTLLHKVQTTFTHTLYPGFRIVGYGSSVKLFLVVLLQLVSMADAFLKEQDSFFCAICLELLRDPVAIPCGHNYCMGCINSYWDQDEQRGWYSCPQCRQTSPQRPVLNKNPLIAQLVDSVRTRLTGASVANKCLLPTHIICEFCSGVKILPGDTVLPCLSETVRVCGAVKRSDSDSEATCHAPGELRQGGRYEVLDAVEQLRDNICSHRENLLEMFCHSQQQCLCYLCPAKKHTAIQVVKSASRMSDKQRELHEPHRKFQQRIQEREKELQEREKEVPELRRVVETLKCRAQAAARECEGIFGGLLRSIERRAEEKAKLQQAEELLRRMEEDIRDLRKDARLSPLSLSHTTRYLPQVRMASLKNALVMVYYFSVLVFLCVNDFKINIFIVNLFILHTPRLYTLTHCVFSVIAVQSVLPPEPQTRDEFLQYSCPLTLDPNTVHRELVLSQGSRKVTHCDEYQSYPPHPNRFDGWEQVLCREGASGRRYWEVEWSGEEVSVAVSYKDIGRKGHGRECGFGSNGQSWSLDCSKGGYSFRHDNEETELPLVASSNRIGVYVDHRAGTLAFYSISGSMMTLLHRVQTTFTHTLYPGFWLGFNFHYGPSSVRLL
ncbi:hypothetical protein ACEWY4_012357 [Coilia grayii]|uniref:Tripartite motif-containing protein 16-like n=1 Tax=Coilia grayii TaxID=363190 RepID=A0ABD1K0A4_9TELE